MNPLSSKYLMILWPLVILVVFCQHYSQASKYPPPPPPKMEENRQTRLKLNLGLHVPPIVIKMPRMELPQLIIGANIIKNPKAKPLMINMPPPPSISFGDSAKPEPPAPPPYPSYHAAGSNIEVVKAPANEFQYDMKAYGSDIHPNMVRPPHNMMMGPPPPPMPVPLMPPSMQYQYPPQYYPQQTSGQANVMQSSPQQPQPSGQYGPPQPMPPMPAHSHYHPGSAKQSTPMMMPPTMMHGPPPPPPMMPPQQSSSSHTIQPIQVEHQFYPPQAFATTTSQESMSTPMSYHQQSMVSSPMGQEYQTSGMMMAVPPPPGMMSMSQPAMVMTPPPYQMPQTPKSPFSLIKNPHDNENRFQFRPNEMYNPAEAAAAYASIPQNEFMSEELGKEYNADMNMMRRQRH